MDGLVEYHDLFVTSTNDTNLSIAKMQKIKDEYIRDVFRTLSNISDGYFLRNTTA